MIKVVKKAFSLLSQMLTAKYWLSSRGHGIKEKEGRLLCVRRVSYGLTLTVESEDGTQSQVHWRIAQNTADIVCKYCRELQTSRRLVINSEYWRAVPTDVRHCLTACGTLAYYDGLLMYNLASDVGVILLGD